MKIFKKLIAVFAAVIMAASIAVLAGCNNANERDTSKFAKQDFAAVEITGTISDDDEVTGNFKGKINFDGTADIIVNPYKEYFEYIFLRDWKYYHANSYEETNDFTTEDLTVAIDFKAFLERFNYDMQNTKSLINNQIYSLNSVVLNFAEDFNALGKADGKFTADVTKAIYNAIAELKTVINGFTEKTTIGDILKNATVKKIVTKLTNVVTPEEFIETIKNAILSIGDEGEVISEKVNELLNTIKPDKNSTTYDYLVKLIGSQETVDFINGMLGGGVGITKKLSDFTLDELISLAGINESFEEVKKGVIEVLSECVTETWFKFDVRSTYSYDIKMEYTYNSQRELTSQNIVFTIFDSYDNSTETYNLNITYKDKAFPASDFITLPAQLPEIENNF